MKLLLVEDDRDLVRELRQAVLEPLGEDVAIEAAPDAASAIESVRAGPPHLIVLDMSIPRDRTPGAPATTQGGLAVLEHVTATFPWIRVIVLSGQDPDFAVKLLTSHRGVRDYVFKSATHREMQARIGKQLEEIRGALAIRALAGEELVGDSQAMRRLGALIERIAPEPVTVLVRGETGTGKELVARRLHRLSTRSGGPLVTVHCAAFSESVLESEIFGHVKGAFTGATESRVGRFEAADGGTLFLDEVGELSEGIQVKLLRFLQDRQFEPVGSSRTQCVDARLVLATNRDLEAAIGEGRMREDFYFRIRGVTLRVPPLRERTEDIPLLARHILEGLAHRRGRPVPALSSSCLDRLAAHAWPGNVRELAATLEEAALIAQGSTIEPDDLPHPLSGAAATAAPGAQATLGQGGSLQEKLERHEKQLLVEALEATGYDVSRAAQRLGLERRTMHNRLNHHKISRRRKRFDST